MMSFVYDDFNFTYCDWPDFQRKSHKVKPKFFCRSQYKASWSQSQALKKHFSHSQNFRIRFAYNSTKTETDQPSNKAETKLVSCAWKSMFHLSVVTLLENCSVWQNGVLDLYLETSSVLLSWSYLYWSSKCSKQQPAVFVLEHTDLYSQQ